MSVLSKSIRSILYGMEEFSRASFAWLRAFGFFRFCIAMSMSLKFFVLRAEPKMKYFSPLVKCSLSIAWIDAVVSSSIMWEVYWRGLDW